MPDEPRDWEQLAADALTAVNDILDDTPLAERLTEAILAIFDEDAVNRLGQQYVEESRLRSLDFRDGGRMELEPAKEAAAMWVGAARGMLDGTGAPNYVEMTIGIGEDRERYVFTVQRAGKLTPHQARERAEAGWDAAKDVVREMFNYLVPVTDEARQRWCGRAGIEGT